MSTVKTTFSKYFVAGLLALLPIAILGFFFRWLFGILTDLIQPFTNILIRSTGLPEIASDLIVCLIIVICVFMIGLLVTTSFGLFLHTRFDVTLQRVAPGYQMVKDIVNQFMGDKSNSPFRKGAVARVRIFGGAIDTSVTAIITSQHEDGSYTVFVPTGPNPTSGFIYHVPAEYVELRPDIKIESAMRTVIACGAGSDKLFKPQP